MLEMHPLEASACDLAVSVSENPQGLDGLCIYKMVLFEATTITRMCGDYQQILEQLIAATVVCGSRLCTHKEVYEAER